MIDTDELKARYDLRELAGQYTTLKRKTAHEMAGPCVKCGGCDRFYVTIDWFACRRCHEKRGDVIEFVAWLEGLSFKEACERLADGELPTLPDGARRPAPAPSMSVAEPPADDWQDQAIKVVVHCAEMLWSDAGTTWLAYLRDRGLDDNVIKTAWLGLQSADGELCGLYVPEGLVIPHWHQAANTIWGLNVRRPGEKVPKYLQVADGKLGLYGADSLAGQDVAVVCEGEFDTLLLAQHAGDLAAAFTFGGAASHDVDAWLPYLLHVKRLLIATDNDKSGEEAWHYWKRKTKRAKRLAPPGGAKDITDAWKDGADLRAWALDFPGECIEQAA